MYTEARSGEGGAARTSCKIPMAAIDRAMHSALVRLELNEPTLRADTSAGSLAPDVKPDASAATKISEIQRDGPTKECSVDSVSRHASRSRGHSIEFGNRQQVTGMCTEGSPA